MSCLKIPGSYNFIPAEYVINSPYSSNNIQKREDEKSIYKNIVSLNRRAPLYHINLTEENQSFVLSLKDTALRLAQNAKELYSDQADTAFSYVKSYSENPDTVSSLLISDDMERYPDTFDIKINQLACAQINASTPVPKNKLNASAGNYSFSINLLDTSYSFQYTIKGGQTNEQILNRLADFINQSKIGLYCHTEEVTDEHLQLFIESNDTGFSDEPLFNFLDTESPEGEDGLVTYYGLNQIIQDSKSASFLINGAKKESLTNEIVLNQTLQLNLLSANEENVQISYMPDSSKIIPYLNTFRKQYNHLIDIADSYSSNQGLSKKLLDLMKKIRTPFKNQLESCGISFDDGGKMQFDQNLLSEAIETKEINPLFSHEGYLGALARNTYTIQSNPMEYVDKLLITYPNISKPRFVTPYITSIYSGMFFNYYC